MARDKNSRKQQARIAFTPLASTSPAAKDYHPQIQSRAAAVRYEMNGTSPLKRKSGDCDSEHLPSSSCLPTPDTPQQRTTTTKHKLPRVRQQRLDLSAFTPATQTQSSPIRAAPATSSQAMSSDSDDQPRRSHKKRRIRGGFMSSGRTSRSQRQIDLEPVAPVRKSAAVSSPLQSQSDTESDEDDMPTTIGTRKRGHRQRQASLSPPIQPPSEDEVEIVKVRNVDESEEDDDSDLPVQTPKRRLLNRSRNKLPDDPKMTQQDREDLAEDLDFLAPSSDDDAPKPARDTQTVRKNARLAALNALKRKRAGADDVRERPISGAAENEPEVESADEEEASDLDYQQPPPTSSRSMFQADDEDEDFLDDDAGDAVLGVPEDLPIEFSKYASMKPKELFKFAIEWMVQKKINPAFESKDGLYDLTFTKLDDEVSGLVRSKYSSAAWTAEFTLALRARPEIEVSAIGGFAEDRCDACNRSKHPASTLIRFHGKPYHVATLDDIENADDDNSDTEDDEDETCHDTQGRQIPPASKTYQVGSHCAKNAQTAHELSHWKRNLYHFVRRWIDDENFNTAAKIVERDSWSTKKRRKHANKIADRMHEEGVTKKLWKEFQDAINRARDSQQGRY